MAGVSPSPGADVAGIINRGTCSACGFVATCPRSVDIVVLMFVAAAVSLLGMLVTQVAQAPAQVWQG